MRQLDIFEFVLEHKEDHVALRVGSGRTTPNEDFRVLLCISGACKDRAASFWPQYKANDSRPDLAVLCLQLKLRGLGALQHWPMINKGEPLLWVLFGKFPQIPKGFINFYTSYIIPLPIQLSTNTGHIIFKKVRGNMRDLSNTEHLEMIVLA